MLHSLLFPLHALGGSYHHLSPPDPSSWRRVHSDSAIHQSVGNNSNIVSNASLSTHHHQHHHQHHHNSHRHHNGSVSPVRNTSPSLVRRGNSLTRCLLLVDFPYVLWPLQESTARAYMCRNRLKFQQKYKTCIRYQGDQEMPFILIQVNLILGSHELIMDFSFQT